MKERGNVIGHLECEETVQVRVSYGSGQGSCEVEIVYSASECG